MFKRFTERARQVITLAQEEARGLNHPYIGSEHLLLGLFREEEGLGARALESLGLQLQRTRADVSQRWNERPWGPGDVPDLELGASAVDLQPQVPLTPRAKLVLERALREALSLGHNYIGTEHILLGLAREGDSAGAKVLRDRGVDYERVYNEVIRLLSGPRTGQRAEAEPVARPLLRGRLAYSLYVKALAEEVPARGRRYENAPLAWEFLSAAERKAWDSVGSCLLSQQEEPS
jgi:ATP-dependent Clp protease ATP-binding subunit ClpA